MSNLQRRCGVQDHAVVRAFEMLANPMLQVAIDEMAMWQLFFQDGLSYPMAPKKGPFIGLLVEL